MLVENFRAGVMDRLGLGWEALHARYPRLIYAATSGFGHTGPYAEAGWAASARCGNPHATAAGGGGAV